MRSLLFALMLPAASVAAPLDPRCAEEAQAGAAAGARAAAAAPGARVQGDARAWWAEHGPGLRACAAVADADHRWGCLERLGGFIARSRAATVGVDAGAASVDTACGVWRATWPAGAQPVAIPELIPATDLLYALWTGPNPSALPSGGDLRSPVLGGLIVAPAGAFIVGARPGERDATADEAPVPVRLRGDVAVMAREVTRGMWRAALATEPPPSPGCPADDCPVTQVSWRDAVQFANRVSELEGLTPAYAVGPGGVSWDRRADGYRLPTEAEWERAARAGGAHRCAGDDDCAAVGWLARNSGRVPHPTCGLRPNAWGLCDATGNVSEWTWDVYNADRVGGWDPVGAPSTGWRTRRGGGFVDDGSGERVAARGVEAEDARRPDLGFRLVRSFAR